MKQSSTALVRIGQFDPEDLPPEFKPTINFVHKVSKLFGDIKADVMGFVNVSNLIITWLFHTKFSFCELKLSYNYFDFSLIFLHSPIQAVEQSIKVVIPHQSKAIYESIKDIINGFSKILKNPKAALASIGKGAFT